ncbi:MAG: tRNA pseudouridine(55) synthase TruB [Pseudomonadota bacterium]
MARRKRGRRVDGWLIVDKSAGVTSTQVVGRVRWAFEAQKAGHAGTLDPLATGLLAVALGEATKTIPYAQNGLKTYRFTANWGAETTTDDLEGEITRRCDNRPSEADIYACLPTLMGEIMQTPPIYSAIKVDGARAYDLARAGEEVALKARPIQIDQLALLSADRDRAEFEMVCGKGGYVRSMARDLGQALGCLGHVETLRRTRSGGFDLDQAIPFDQVEALKTDTDRDARLLPVAAGLAELPSIDIDAETAARLRHGDTAAAPDMDAPLYWASEGGHPVAIVDKSDGRTRLARVFAP